MAQEKGKMTNAYTESIAAGIGGVIFLTAIYSLILYYTTGDLRHIVEQFETYKYWMTAIILGFGIQVGLFWYAKRRTQIASASQKSAVAASAGVSTTAMVACCAHHLVDILPLIGLSAAALFLTKYQTYFFLMGVISNIAGIILMLKALRRIEINK